MDSCCPECNLFLLPAQDISEQLRADERFLRFAIIAIVLVLILFAYMYYLNLV
ncbi:hypothetical protein ACTXOU_02630 [Psychrobacter glacincola]|jgi:hypothetical protein